MHLEQVNAFYDFVASDQAIYEQYYNSCCIRGLFGVWSWDKKKIVNFAASLGFEFSESELDYVLFDSGAGTVQRSNGYQHVSAY
ncbi:MAG: Nif11-like leader peptide family natural product precursor [Calothrix sp. C42_A2020_038]|nr:Nif11-like leader peptide family natural product precursor [Calothrix sp. C42_A2020_038]